MTKKKREAEMRIPSRDIIANGGHPESAQRNGIGFVADLAPSRQSKSIGARRDAADTKLPLAFESAPIQYRHRSRSANATLARPAAEAAPIAPAEIVKAAVVEDVDKVEGVEAPVEREADEACLPASPSVPNAAVPYEVGYKRPPKHSQFKPGESGNKKGRPKGTKNFDTIFDEQLNATRLVKIDGVFQKRSNLEITIQQVINKGAAGELKPAQWVLGKAQARHEAASLRSGEGETEREAGGSMSELDPTTLAIMIDYQREALRAEGMTDTQINAFLRSLGLLTPETDQ